MCDRHENYIEPQDSPEERAEREAMGREAQLDVIREELGCNSALDNAQKELNEAHKILDDIFVKIKGL